MSNVRDRTAELFSTVASLPLQRSSNSSLNPARPSTFHNVAHELGHSLSLTTVKLSRLGRLVRKTSLVDDSTDEFNELTRVLTEDLRTIEREMIRLNEVRGKEKNNDVTAHERAIVGQLRSMVKENTRQFMDLLQTRTKVKQAHAALPCVETFAKC